MLFGPLYSKTKLNKIVQWKAWTEGDAIHVEYGELEGKKQHTVTVSTPKNVGKKNETTASEQALLEAQSQYQSRLDRKYALTPEAASEIPLFPMLAQDFNKHKKKLVYPVFVQPKLDGVRCLAYRVDGEVRLFSRNNKEYIGHHQIIKALDEFLPHNLVLDGELYLHGANFQDIVSAVKKPDINKLSLQYHIYDVFDPSTDAKFIKRIQTLGLLSKEFNSFLVEVDTRLVSTEQAIYNILEAHLSQGYEGAIIRNVCGNYEPGFRSKSLLKLKKFQDQEFKIVGHKTGIGKFSDCVIWKCVQEDGLEFDVVPKGTIADKNYWASNAQQYYGQLLTVRFFDRSKDNIPRFPVGITIRNYE